MKLKKIKLKNFRSYKDEVIINIDDLTVFVGKNDIGKSTVLEALDIFFNEGKGIIKLDKDDINKTGLEEGNKDIYITAVFSELPATIIIDATNETSFSSEYLLNSEGCLEIIKKYPNAGSAKVFIKANHPTHSICADLLLKKQNDYRKIIQANSIICDNQILNATMRHAIWNHFCDDLQLQEVEIDTSKEDAKNIWEKIQTYLPIYSLFQSDRKNSDGDSEVQDPLKDAVKQILLYPEIQSLLDTVAQRVSEQLTEVSNGTLKMLREMNPEIASTLNPVIPPTTALNWADVFKKVSISGDGNIPINKRGSGVKRLILLNFFRSEAERKRRNGISRSMIYAIEEPETSQHTEHQKLLMQSFKDLSQTHGVQVLLTTHSCTVVKGLDFSNLRLISKEGEYNKCIMSVIPKQLPYPSLNEINYIAFRELTEEYHNELYGYIEGEGLLSEYKAGKATINYNKLKNGTIQTIQIILTEYIRHQIHHPENTHNIRFNFEQLEESVNAMRTFILNNKV